jgi:Domain of unknown function (DUF4397)
MRRWPFVLGTALALGIGHTLSATAQAADAYLIHGIPGVEPVDISVNGSCDFDDVNFGDTAGPVELPAGVYDIAVFLDGGGACDGDLAITGAFNVSLLDTAVLVAHLDANGAPVLSKFTTNAAATAPGNARLTVYHTAVAPAVDIRLRGTDPSQRLNAFRLQNGEQTFPAELAAGDYQVKVSPSATRSFEFKPPVLEADVTLDDATSYAVFAVGSVADDTLTVLPLVIAN